MNYCVVKGKTKYIALAKEKPFTSETPDPILEPGWVWFEFGDTQEKALDRLIESLKKNHTLGRKTRCPQCANPWDKFFCAECGYCRPVKE